MGDQLRYSAARQAIPSSIPTRLSNFPMENPRGRVENPLYKTWNTSPATKKWSEGELPQAPAWGTKGLLNPGRSMTFSKTFEGNDGSLVMFQNTRMGSYQVAKQRNERNLEAKKQHVQKLETRKQMLETDLAEKKAARAQLRETRRNIRVQEERSAIVIQAAKRSAQAREHTRALRHLRNMKMANRIQRRYRAKVRVEEAREVVAARKQEQVDHAAAVTIQAFFTNVIAIQMARRVTALKKMEKQLLVDKEWREFEAAGRLQATVRGTNARRETRKMKKAQDLEKKSKEKHQTHRRSSRSPSRTATMPTSNKGRNSRSTGTVSASSSRGGSASGSSDRSRPNSRTSTISGKKSPTMVINPKSNSTFFITEKK